MYLTAQTIASQEKSTSNTMYTILKHVLESIYDIDYTSNNINNIPDEILFSIAKRSYRLYCDGNSLCSRNYNYMQILDKVAKLSAELDND